MAFLMRHYQDDEPRIRPVSTGARYDNALALDMFTDRKPFDRPEWHGQAACGRNGVLVDMTPAERVAVFFVERGQSTALAKEICASCPVKALCDRPDGERRRHGIWAGTTERSQRDPRWKRAPIRCVYCTQKFLRTSPTQQACSDECRTKARIRVNRKSRQKRKAS